MKRKLQIIGLVLISGIFSVVLLYFLSDRAIHQPGSFARLFPPHAVNVDKWIDVKYNGYYVAGATDHTIYLGNSIVPFHVLMLSKSLTDTTHISINMNDSEKQRLRSLNVKVDSPYFYLSDGRMPGLFTGNVNDWSAMRYMYDSAYFIESIPISKTSFAIRSVNKNNEYVIGKETNTSPHLQFKPGLLEKQLDGLFCVDGMLNYSPELARLVYVYHYRNQYIQFDTSLNLVSRGNTIDTTTRVKIKPAKITSENAYTLASPAHTVNKQACVAKNRLFVHSNLMAKNEEAEQFASASVIDVYNLLSNQYEFSFYLYNGGAKMTFFKVFNNYLVVLYNNRLFTYTLTPRYFSD